jgi:exosortase
MRVNKSTQFVGAEVQRASLGQLGKSVWKLTTAHCSLRRAMVAALLCSYAPLLISHVRRLWAYDYYRYFPVVLLGVAWLTWVRLLGGASLGAIVEQTLEFGRWHFRRAWISAQQRSRATTCVVCLRLASRRLLQVMTRACSPAAESRWLLLAAWLLLAVAVLLGSPWLAAVSAIFTLGGLLLAISQHARIALPVWLLLWLLIPLPFRWDTRLVFWLQGFTSRAGSSLLDLLSYNHLLAGHVLEVPHQRFLVEEACSGIRSLFTLLAFTALAVVWTSRPLVRSLLLLLAAVFWAAIGNVVRVFAVVAFYVSGGIDVSSGWRHEMLGAALFAVALVLIGCTDRLLCFLTEPIRELQSARWNDGTRRNALGQHGRSALGLVPTAVSPQHDRARKLISGVHEITQTLQQVSHRYTRLLTPTNFCLLFSLLVTAQAVTLAAVPSRTDVAGAPNDLGLGRETLAEDIHGWKLINYETQTRDSNSQLGRWSATWTYRAGESAAVVSCDYPFVGWHHLTRCYEALGWKVLKQEILIYPGEQDPLQAPIVQVEMEQSGGDRSVLLFSQFDRDGNWVDPPGAAAVSASSWQRALTDRILKRKHEFGFDLSTFQVQLFVSDSEAVLQTLRPELMRVLLESRARLHESLTR